MRIEFRNVWKEQNIERTFLGFCIHWERGYFSIALCNFIVDWFWKTNKSLMTTLSCEEGGVVLCDGGEGQNDNTR